MKAKASETKGQRLRSYRDYLPRAIYLWLAQPQKLRLALGHTIRQACIEIQRWLDANVKKLHKDEVVSAYLYSLLLSRVIRLSKTCHGAGDFGSPLSRLHSFGYWLDELRCPEEIVWLTMTVPRRVWFYLVNNPVKRQKFLNFIASEFPDEIKYQDMQFPEEEAEETELNGNG